MAIGGALRAAIRAGRFGVAGRESRRQVRALASLNEGGVGSLGGRPRDLFPFPGVERGFDSGPISGMGLGETSRGSVIVVDTATGRRAVLPQSFDEFVSGRPDRGPIQAPYEGVRVWDNASYFDNPPPFVGRGRPPFPDMPALEQYGYPGLGPSANDPFSVNVPRAFGGIANYGDYAPAFNYTTRERPRFFFDDLSY